jgi:hypothetical protein
MAENYGLKTMKLYCKSNEGTSTLDDLLNLIEAEGKEVAEGLATRTSK